MWFTAEPHIVLVVNDYSKHIRKQWQTRWERSTTARATFALIPVVGRTIRFPQTRCSAVSYVRLLLDDTALNAHQLRIGLADTRLCRAGIKRESAKVRKRESQ